MPRFKVIIEIDAPDENQAQFLTYADTYVHSKIVKRKGHSTKPRKCQIYYDGVLLDTWGAPFGPHSEHSSIFDSLILAKKTIECLNYSRWVWRKKRLYTIVKV